MKKQRIMLMSGFLGSGKTTNMVAMASYMRSQGKTIALITNDLGSNLVDTNFVSSEGFPVLEISNGCLCHDVDQLVSKLDTLSAEYHPEIILFEPVGSCVDMVNHVYQDILDRYPDKYELAPVSAIVDPFRYLAIYENEGENTFPEEISYMFTKQLDEADLFLINKTDLLNEDQLNAVTASLNRKYPDVPVIPICGKSGRNMNLWAEHVMNCDSQVRPLEIDWEIIMRGAANMGWYNCNCEIVFASAVNAPAFLEELLGRIQQKVIDEKTELAHLKAMLNNADGYVKAALTTKNAAPTVNGELKECCGALNLRINIRALLQPQRLEGFVSDVLRVMLEQYKGTQNYSTLQSFASTENPPEPKQMKS